MKRASILFIALGMAVALPVFAHGDAHSSAREPGTPGAEEKAFGRPGDPAKVARTVRVEMADTMRFAPAEIRIKRAETVRIEARNAGKVMHEIVLGTMQDLKAHAELMRKHPGMEHAEPHMVHVASNATGEIVWQFTQPGEYHYGCLIPGHFEAGMVGRLIVE